MIGTELHVSKLVPGCSFVLEIWYREQVTLSPTSKLSQNLPSPALRLRVYERKEVHISEAAMAGQTIVDAIMKAKVANNKRRSGVRVSSSPMFDTGAVHILYAHRYHRLC